MEPGPSRQRRHTAEQARLLFETIPTDSESDGSESEFDEANCGSSRSSGSESPAVDQQPVNPPPAKQRRRDDNGDLPTWLEVSRPTPKSR